MVVGLRDPSPAVRVNSLTVLPRSSKFGEHAGPAVPALEHALQDTDGNVRKLAVIALKKIAAEGETDTAECRALLNTSPQ